MTCHSTGRCRRANSLTERLIATFLVQLLVFVFSPSVTAESNPISQQADSFDRLGSVTWRFVERTFDESHSRVEQNGFAPSDSLRRDANSAIALYQGGRSRDALNVATGVLKQLGRVKHAPSRFDVAALILMAELQLANGEYRAALALLQQLRVSDAELTGTDGSGRYAIAIVRGRTRSLNARFDEAIKELQAVVGGGDAVSKHDRSALTEVNLELARVTRARGDIQLSMAYCQDAQEILDASEPKSQRQIAQVLLLSAENQIEGLELAKAKLTLAEARSILEENKRTGTPEFIDLLSMESRTACRMARRFT
jgi:hypothetical protein